MPPSLDAPKVESWDDVWARTIAASAWMLEAWFAPRGPDEAANQWIRKAGAEHYGEHLGRLRDWVAELVDLRTRPVADEWEGQARLGRYRASGGSSRCDESPACVADWRRRLEGSSGPRRGAARSSSPTRSGRRPTRRRTGAVSRATSPTWPSSKRAASADVTTPAGRERSRSSRPRPTSCST